MSADIDIWSEDVARDFVHKTAPQKSVKRSIAWADKEPSLLSNLELSKGLIFPL